MKAKFPIKFKFLILIICIVILANLTVGIRTLQISRKTIETSTESSMRNQATSVANSIEEVIQQQFILLEGLAQIPTIQDTNATLQEKCELLGFIKEMNPEKYNNIGYCSVDGKSLVGNRVMDFSKRDLYLNATKGKRFVSEPSISTFGQPLWLMYYSVPVMKSGQFLGAVLSVVVGNDLDKIAGEIDIGGGNHPVIIDRKTQQIIGRADRVEMESSAEDEKESKDFKMLLDAVMNNKEGYFSYRDEKSNELRLVSYCQVPDEDAPWSVVCNMPANYYLNGIAVIKHNVVYALVGTLLISIIIASLLLSAILKPLLRVNKSMEEIASGNADLTVRIQQTTNDEVGQLVHGFNAFTEKMQVMIQDLQSSNIYLEEVGGSLDTSTEKTSQSINIIIEDINDVSRQIDVQYQSVHETAGAVNEIASNIESLEHMIEKQSEEVSEASNAVQQMVENISDVNNSVDLMASSFSELISSAKEGSLIQNDVNVKIEQILEQSKTLQEANIAIAAIAEQTNLLAMNAAIEAAHAGEAGKGFSVVADEIRKLSETSSDQSNTIGNHLTTIQNSIQNVVDACTKSSQAFESMSERISMTDGIVKKIKVVMEEQISGSQQIDSSLHAMNDSTVEVRNASQEMALGNKAILDGVSILQDATGVMKKSMETMSDSADKITETGNSLSDISQKMRDSISEIGEQINQFKV